LEYFGWGFPIEYFAGSRVEGVRDCGELLRVVRHYQGKRGSSSRAKNELAASRI
jgi:hypothetical protein